MYPLYLNNQVMEYMNQDLKMAFDGDHATFSSSLISPIQHEHSANVGDGNGCSSTLPFSIPGVSQQEQDTASYMPWFHNAHDDPYGLISYAQSIAKSRETTDNTDCEGESDLQGLVSNILDEADSKENYFTEGYLSMCDPGSIKTLSEELLQYLESEVVTQHNPISAPINVSCEAKEWSADNHVEDFYQQFKGLSTSREWFSNPPNRDGDSYPFYPQKLPPGLPIPNIRNSYPSQTQRCQYDNMSVANQPVNSFPDLGHVFKPQCEMNGFCNYPNFDNQSIQSSTDTSSSEQYVPQDINQLISSFQTFKAAEHDGLCCGDFPNMDSSVEQWKITSPTVSAQIIHAMQKPKQQVGIEGPVQMKTDHGVRNQAFKSDDFQDLPAFSPQIKEYLQQPKSFSGSFSLPNQYPNEMTTQRENTSLLMNTPRMTPYSEHHIHQGQIPSNIQSQVQKGMKWVNTPGFQGEDFSARPPIKTTDTRRVNKKRTQNPNHFGKYLSREFEGENGLMGAGNPKQLMSVMCPTNDPRRDTSIPINPSNFNSRFILPNGHCLHDMDTGDIMTVEATGYRSFNDSMMTHGKSPYHSVASKMEAPMGMKKRPRTQVFLYLEECCEQWRSLVKERKKAEAILTKTFPEKKVPFLNTKQPRTTPNATEIDHLVVNQMREGGRVASLLHRMENLNESPLHINIQTALNKHHMAISSLQLTWAKYKHEMLMMYSYMQQTVHFNEDQEMLLLVIALTDMAATTKKLRAALWRALQMTLPKPVPKQDHHVNREDTGTNRCLSPCEGYSFKLF